MDNERLKGTVLTVPRARWREAQVEELEYARQNMRAGDDWNEWWYNQFDQYKAIVGRRFGNVLEAGCGPHTNIRYLRSRVATGRVYLEDPLIDHYLAYNAGLFGRRPFVQEITDAEYTACPLEDLVYRDGMMDVVICINVLDHVQDYDRCMAEMDRVLASGGILILGQDLSNGEDMANCPESYTDIAHPIKVDLDNLKESLKCYTPVFERILPRERGRNPKCHYGTYLGILQKVY